VRDVLDADGHRAIVIPVDARLSSRLATARVDLVFNTYFGPARRQDQARVASLMELANVPFTGGDAACHFIGLSKPYSKMVFRGCGLPTPRFLVADNADGAARSAEREGMGFPMIVKAPAEGEGIGIDARSVVRSRAELEDAVGRVVSVYAQPALVEEFMPGREFTVGVLDGATPRVLPILEILLGGEPTYSYGVKTEDTVKDACPAEVSAEEAADMGRLAMSAGRAIGCRDFWRVDLRADARGAPQILEVNTLPGLQPGYSDITRMAGPAGMTYAEIVRGIIVSAARR
jgi:D-alanine-D-alanine ligase